MDGVDFTVEKGEFAIIVGPSGAGKTGTVNILARLASGCAFHDETYPRMRVVSFFVVPHWREG